MPASRRVIERFDDERRVMKISGSFLISRASIESSRIARRDLVSSAIPHIDPLASDAINNHGGITRGTTSTQERKAWQRSSDP
jgi:FMN-dependent NADH-azoreductase